MFSISERRILNNLFLLILGLSLSVWGEVGRLRTVRREVSSVKCDLESFITIVRRLSIDANVVGGI